MHSVLQDSDSLEFPEFPGGPVPLNSGLYIERPPLEPLAYAEVEKPGSLIRIKAAAAMGKSSLVHRILAHAASQGLATVHLDLEDADETVLTSFSPFVRWVCAVLTQQLQQDLKIDDYWDGEVGSKVSASLYLQGYLLPRLDQPVVLAISQIDRLFEHPQTAREFLSLLRSWYEKAKQVELWQKLRFVVSYSTESYVPLDINQSPFNIGLPLKLPPFTAEQVQELARRYEIDEVESAASQSFLSHLLTLTGGHPYLVSLGLYHWRQQTPEVLLQQAATESGIYSNHLRRLLDALQAEPNLEDAFKQVISVDAPVRLEPSFAHKLDGLGLVTFVGDRVTASCQLYRLYFQEKLSSYREMLLKLEHLNRSRHKLDALVSSLITPASDREAGSQRYVQLDELTQVATRQYFETYLQQEWKRALREQVPLSLVLLDIDYFKVYNESYGQSAGDLCLQKVAAVLRESAQRPADLVARYGGEEFVLLLPQTDRSGAVFVAETLRLQVSALGIACDYSMLDGLPSSVLTVSVGVATIIPDSSTQPSALIEAANRALYQSKRQGRNRVSALDL
ncbi:MAG: AAA-like domain-containing protein [Synechococcales cyanobacterium C42_A2020_086]|jgi:diguanylate cyclase (GGDEF)-like protein|nr:AAA-like domain-containing protein [Synechococcales cyanobacterium C42_A2020_086]